MNDTRTFEEIGQSQKMAHQENLSKAIQAFIKKKDAYINPDITIAPKQVQKQVQKQAQNFQYTKIFNKTKQIFGKQTLQQKKMQILSNLETVFRYTHSLSWQEYEDFLTSMDYNDDDNITQEARKYGGGGGGSGGGGKTSSLSSSSSSLTRGGAWDGRYFGCQNPGNFIEEFGSDYKPFTDTIVLIPSMFYQREDENRLHALFINIDAYLALGAKKIVIFYYGKPKILDFLKEHFLPQNDIVKFVLYSCIGSPHIGYARMAIAKYMFCLKDDQKVILTDDRRFIGANSMEQFKVALDLVMQNLDNAIISPAKNIDEESKDQITKRNPNNYPTQIVFSKIGTLKSVYRSALAGGGGSGGVSYGNLPACFSRIMEDYSFASQIPDRISYGYCNLICRTTLPDIQTYTRKVPKNYFLAKVLGPSNKQQSLQKALQIANPVYTTRTFPNSPGPDKPGYKIKRGKSTSYVVTGGADAATSKYISYYLTDPKPTKYNGSIMRALQLYPDLLKERVDDFIDYDGATIYNPYNREDLINYIYTYFVIPAEEREPAVQALATAGGGGGGEDSSISMPDVPIIKYFDTQRMYISEIKDFTALNPRFRGDYLRLYRLNKEYLVNCLIDLRREQDITIVDITAIVENCLRRQKQDEEDETFELEQTDSQISQLQQLEIDHLKILYPPITWNPKRIYPEKCLMVVPSDKGKFKQCGNFRQNGREYCSRHIDETSSYGLKNIKNYYHLDRIDLPPLLVPETPHDCKIEIINNNERLRNVYSRFTISQAKDFIYFDSMVVCIYKNDGNNVTDTYLFEFDSNMRMIFRRTRKEEPIKLKDREWKKIFNGLELPKKVQVNYKDQVKAVLDSRVPGWQVLKQGEIMHQFDASDTKDAFIQSLKQLVTGRGGQAAKRQTAHPQAAGGGGGGQAVQRQASLPQAVFGGGGGGQAAQRQPLAAFRTADQKAAQYFRLLADRKISRTDTKKNDVRTWDQVKLLEQIRNKVRTDLFIDRNIVETMIPKINEHPEQRKDLLKKLYYQLFDPKKIKSIKLEKPRFS